MLAEGCDERSYFSHSRCWAPRTLCLPSHPRTQSSSNDCDGLSTCTHLPLQLGGACSQGTTNFVFDGWKMENILGSVFAQFEHYSSAIAMQFCMQGEEDNIAVFTNMKEFEQLLGCMGLLSTTAASDVLVKRCIKWHSETLKQVNATPSPLSPATRPHSPQMAHPPDTM